jgi:hypothetical protein
MKVEIACRGRSAGRSERLRRAPRIQGVKTMAKKKRATKKAGKKKAGRRKSRRKGKKMM